MVAIAGFTRDQIFRAVRDMYGEVATAPSRRFHFPTGREAGLFVGYPRDWLDALPASATESFAGVGFPFRAGIIRRGDVVLDVGAGAGTDTLIAARLVGPEGRVFALDMTPAMLGKLGQSVYHAGLQGNRILFALAELVIGWRLAAGAQVALGKVVAAATAEDKAFYRGKLATARWYAKNVLPGLSLTRKLIEASDLDLMELPDDSW